MVLREVVKALNRGGHADAAAIQADLDSYPHGQKPELWTVVDATVDLLTTNWVDFEMVSDALYERETLFQEEAAFIVTAPKRIGYDPFKKFMVAYLRDRQPIEPPSEWTYGLEGDAGVFYEGPQTFFERFGAIAGVAGGS